MKKEMITLSKECPMCHKVNSITVGKAKYEAFLRDEIDYDVLCKHLSRADRELLNSGICKECLDKIFSDL